MSDAEILIPAILACFYGVITSLFVIRYSMFDIK
jgi:hypothetical protein